MFEEHNDSVESADLTDIKLIFSQKWRNVTNACIKLIVSFTQDISLFNILFNTQSSSISESVFIL